MSLLSSKLIAINIVDLSDEKSLATHQLHSSQPVGENVSRLHFLESQIEDLKQWKASLSPITQTGSLAAITALQHLPPASPPSSVSSLQSRDIDVGDPDDGSRTDYSAIKPTIPNSPTPAPVQVLVQAPVKLAQTSSRKPDLAAQIMEIIQQYGRNETNIDGQTWLGRHKFEPRVQRAIENETHVPFVLPAFPWKSVNKVEKVTGIFPDLGEVLALGRLNQMCEDIETIYPPGARITITTDGLCYNDLLGIPDEDVYDYGSALRQIPEQKGYKNIDFLRINNLLGLTDKAVMSKEEYVKNTDTVRETLIQRYLDPGFEASEAIEKDPDMNMTYCGYIRFLTTDLRHSPITAGIQGRNEYKRVVKRVAQDMITRGKAFAAAIDEVFPDIVRLSIHRSTGLTKLSFPLVPQPLHFSMSPWHCCIAVTAKGDFRTAHKSGIEKTHRLIEQNGRPHCYVEPSELFDLGEDVDFEFEYPKALIIRARAVEGREAPRLGAEGMRKVKKLAEGFSPVITSGFVV